MAEYLRFTIRADESLLDKIDEIEQERNVKIPANADAFRSGNIVDMTVSYEIYWNKDGSKTNISMDFPGVLHSKFEDIK